MPDNATLELLARADRLQAEADIKIAISREIPRNRRLLINELESRSQARLHGPSGDQEHARLRQIGGQRLGDKLRKCSEKFLEGLFLADLAGIGSPAPIIEEDDGMPVDGGFAEPQRIP